MNFDTFYESLRVWFLDYGWSIILTLFIIYLIRQFGWLVVNKVITSSVEKSERFENERDRKLRIDTLSSIFGSIINVVTGVAIVITIFSELGLFKYLAPLLGSAVAVSLILGFGIQAFVKDFISGIFIVAENQYRVGDVVSLTTSVGGNAEGTILRITLRTTVLRDNDGAIHFIPNGNIARAANQTLDYAKVNIEIPLPLSADIEKAQRAISALGIAMSKEDLWHSAFVQAPFYHGVQIIEKEGLTIEVRAKTKPTDQWRVSSELRKRLAELVSTNNYFERKKNSK